MLTFFSLLAILIIELNEYLNCRNRIFNFLENQKIGGIWDK